MRVAILVWDHNPSLPVGEEYHEIYLACSLQEALALYSPVWP